MQFDNIEDLKKLAYDQLCEFINMDLDDDHNCDLFLLKFNTLLKLMRMNGVTIVSDFSPYYEFIGIANDMQMVYTQRNIR